jgi:thioredoxin reductase
LSETPSGSAHPPVVAILGAGPAGLSAGLWLRNLGFAPWLIESQPKPGGMQNLNFLPNDWVLGQDGLTGPQLVERFVAHAAQFGVRPIVGCRVVEISGRAGAFALRYAPADGAVEQVACAALLIATGTRYRGAEVLAATPGAAAVPAGRIFYGPYAFADLAGCAGRRVLVVGGGDNAYENVRLLAERGARIDLVLRSPPRAQRHLRERVDAAAAAGACRIHAAARIAGLGWDAQGIAVVLHSGAGTQALTADRIHVLAGYEPDTGFLAALDGDLRAALHRDAQGYLSVDAQCRTGAAGIYAAGDICNPAFPSVVSAVAQGAQAAKTIELDLRAG